MFGTSRHFSAMRNLVIIDAQRTSIKPHQARFMNTTPSRIGVNRRSGWRNSAICRKSSRYILSRLKPGRDKMADLYVLVHGAWHTGAEMEAVAQHLRKDGHQVHCPTIAGNNAGDDRSKVGLEEAIASITNYIESKGLHDVRLVGHSYGGMIISGIADRLADRIKRLVYINAFVPLNGECLNDMVPPHYIGLFDAVAGANNNAVMLPFEIWRESMPISRWQSRASTSSICTPIGPSPTRSR
jgi:pimeloyl-ACP methyl ester carboxylesterase